MFIFFSYREREEKPYQKSHNYLSTSCIDSMYVKHICMLQSYKQKTPQRKKKNQQLKRHILFQRMIGCHAICDSLAIQPGPDPYQNM